MSDELIDVIDENGKSLGISRLKHEIHKNGDWYKSAHVWIIKDKKILLQKRSSKKQFFPNRFDVACAGHAKSGESYEGTAIRELFEELGIIADKNDLKFLDERKQISVDETNTLTSRALMRVFLFYLISDLNELKIEKKEIAELRLFDMEELKELLHEKPEIFVDDKKYFFEIIEKISNILKK